MDGVITVIFKCSFLLRLFFLLARIIAIACICHYSLFSFGSSHYFAVFTFPHNILFNFFMKFITIRIQFYIFCDWFMVLTIKFRHEVLHFLMRFSFSDYHFPGLLKVIFYIILSPPLGRGERR